MVGSSPYQQGSLERENFGSATRGSPSGLHYEVPVAQAVLGTSNIKYMPHTFVKGLTLAGLVA